MHTHTYTHGRRGASRFLTNGPLGHRTCVEEEPPQGFEVLDHLGGVVLSLPFCFVAGDTLVVGITCFEGPPAVTPSILPNPGYRLYGFYFRLYLRYFPSPLPPLEGKIWCFVIRKISPLVPHPPTSPPPSKALI
jgi:hypothetical protein